MKRVRKLLRHHWKRIAFASVAIAATCSLLLYRLASLAPSLSPDEKATLATSASWHLIIDNPLHLPLKLLQWLTVFAPSGHELLLSRLPSVFLATASLITFVYVLRRWYGPRTTVFGFAILIAAAWFLHVSRFAGTDVEYLFGMMALLAAYSGLHDNDRPLMFFVWLMTNAIVLFIPGFIWFVVLGIILGSSDIVAAWRQLETWWKRVVWGLAAAIAPAAIIYTFVRSPNLLLPWLGAPTSLPSWQTLLHQFVDTGLALIYRGPHDPQLWLGRLPLLDALGLFALIAGVFFYARHIRATRAQMLLGSFILGMILVSLGGEVQMSAVLPVVYLVIAGGVAYVLHFWLGVFPRNPLARTIGITVVAAVIGLSCFYNLKQYFIAWPHNPETIAVYGKASQ